MNNVSTRLLEEQHMRRRGRTRLLVIGFFIFLGLIVFLESPLTRVREFTVSGNFSIPQQRILQEAKLTHGMSLFQINHIWIEHAIMSHEPLVQAVSVKVDYLQGAVHVQIGEKQVVGILAQNGKLYRLLNDGMVYDQTSAAAGFTVPLITAPDGPIASGHVLTNPDVVDVCRGLGQSDKDVTAQLSEIHVDSFGVATLYLENGFAGETRADKLATMLTSLISAQRYFTQKGYAPGVIDMTGNPPYRYTPFQTTKKTPEAKKH